MDKILPCLEGTVAREDNVSIHYEVYENKSGCDDGSAEPRQKVLMIMGLAASRDGWQPQITDLLSTIPDPRIDICIFDNRGIGKSSAPEHKAQYSTVIMAEDAIAVVDALGWKRFHLVGFSMGGMISMKLAALFPDRLLSLSLLGATEGGWQSLPKSWRAFKYAIKMAMASSLEERSKMDIKFHYSKKTLQEEVNGPGRLRRDCLYEEYLEEKANCDEQSKSGLNGQMHACWHHGMTNKEYAKIQSSQIPMVVIHGRQDLVAVARYGQRIASKLGAKFVEVDGGHLINRECAHDVSHELLRIINDKASQVERKKHLDKAAHSSQSSQSNETGQLPVGMALEQSTEILKPSKTV
ncbi:hypothetical protein BSKO_12281 [Bryopsis sp. KO-2023]|nr:hypothetical protein BSKO_12281 [Bryopsis sp. KO-2023]